MGRCCGRCAGRPRTTLTPTLVLRDGEPVMACGSPGGDQQDQWQLLFLLRHLGAGLDLQEAIDAPAWHTTGFPSSFYPRTSEPGFTSFIAEKTCRTSSICCPPIDTNLSRASSSPLEGPAAFTPVTSANVSRS